MDYIVFQDNLKGMTFIPQMTSSNLEEVVQSIHEGTVGMSMPSQNYMYFIYRTHQVKVPYLNTKVNVYSFVKTVAGSKVEPIFQNHKRMLQYAIDIGIEGYGWVFTDTVFE